MYTNLNKYQAENYPTLLGWNLITSFDRRVKYVLAGWVEISSRKTGTMHIGTHVFRDFVSLNWMIYILPAYKAYFYGSQT